MVIALAADRSGLVGPCRGLGVAPIRPTAARIGKAPTGMVAITVFVAGLITDTVFALKLVT